MIASSAANPGGAACLSVKDAMNRPRLLVLAVSLALSQFAMPAAIAATTVAAAALPATNPFARASALPFNYPAFDRIKDADFTPAFDAAMREQLREIDAIANNRKPATFDNTIVAMERSGQMLARVGAVFSNLQAANTNDQLDAIDTAMSPKLAAQYDA